MNKPGFLCFDNTEIMNERRAAAYLGKFSHTWIGSGLAIPALDVGASYNTPAADPAPWYDAAHPESADFYGLYPQSLDWSSVVGHGYTDRISEGGVMGRETLSSRLVPVSAWAYAKNQIAMAWGQAWLREALRSRPYSAQPPSLTVLDFAREATGGPSTDYDGDFRTLYDVALSSPVTFSPVDDYPSAETQLVQFALEAGNPRLFSPSVSVVAGASVAGGATNTQLITAPTWFDGLACVLALSAGDEAPTNAPTNPTITFTLSLDGTCPETRVAPSITYTVPALEPNSRLIIDAAQRSCLYDDPQLKLAVPGFTKLTWGRHLFPWPVIGPCEQVCVSLHNGGAHPVTYDLSYQGRSV